MKLYMYYVDHKVPLILLGINKIWGKAIKIFPTLILSLMKYSGNHVTYLALCVTIICIFVILTDTRLLCYLYMGWENSTWPQGLHINKCPLLQCHNLFEEPRSLRHKVKPSFSSWLKDSSWNCRSGCLDAKPAKLCSSIIFIPK